MLKNKLFLIALSVSLIIHALILLQNSGFRLFEFNKNKEIPEVSYVKTKKEPEKERRDLGRKKEPLLDLTKLTVKRKIPIPSITKEEINLEKPAIAKTAEITAIKKKVSLSFNKTELQKNATPAYISYEQTIREIIRRVGNASGYLGEENGQVTVSFVVSSSGQLRDFRIADESLSSDDYLKRTALRILKDASPFPPFPKELGDEDVSFNLTIIFEAE
ncbi:MAG: TonB family protein [Candidatus Omnitrophica bacterium]|nr:TonB family protein [Candidatus Omnitrophota bacterium]